MAKETIITNCIPGWAWDMSWGNGLDQDIAIMAGDIGVVIGEANKKISSQNRTWLIKFYLNSKDS